MTRAAVDMQQLDLHTDGVAKRGRAIATAREATCALQAEGTEGSSGRRTSRTAGDSATRGVQLVDGCNTTRLVAGPLKPCHAPLLVDLAGAVGAFHGPYRGHVPKLDPVLDPVGVGLSHSAAGGGT